jgi:hypothetical protein
MRGVRLVVVTAWGWLRRRENAVAALIWVASFAAGVVVPFYYPPMVTWALRADQATPDWMRQARRLDPKPGAVIPLTGVLDTAGRAVTLPAPQTPTCLVFFWACADCAVSRKYADVRTLAREFPRLRVYALVAGGDRDLLRQFEGREGVTVVTDPGGAASRALNAATPGRAYLFDAAGRLAWCSDLAGSWDETVARIRRFAGE